MQTVYVFFLCSSLGSHQKLTTHINGDKAIHLENKDVVGGEQKHKILSPPPTTQTSSRALFVFTYPPSTMLILFWTQKQYGFTKQTKGKDVIRVDSIWNVMEHADVRDGKWRGNWRNGVGSQYSSHYLGTWCIQHYQRWCAHHGCH